MSNEKKGTTQRRSFSNLAASTDLSKAERYSLKLPLGFNNCCIIIKTFNLCCEPVRSGTESSVPIFMTSTVPLVPQAFFHLALLSKNIHNNCDWDENNF